MQKHKNNEARSKFTGSYIQKERAFQTRVLFCGEVFSATNHLLLFLQYEDKCVHHEIFDYCVRRI